MIVSAIVVTHNRKGSLRVCLEKIGAQTRRPDRIIVVDNASSDGTDALMSGEFPEAEYLRLPRNLGGAGGYREGLRHAMTTGSDAAWVMDDDAFAEPDCLSKLVGAMSHLNCEVVGALVLNVKNPDELSFPLFSRGRLARKVGEVEDEYVFGTANLFNGVLIGQFVVSRVGLPDPRLFIRGDEVDYFLRIKAAGLRVVTVKGAVVLHPSGLGEQVPLISDRLIVTYTGSKVKDYCFFRNRAYINKKYMPRSSIFLDALRYAVFFVSRGKLKELALWGRATRDGLREKFNNEF